MNGPRIDNHDLRRAAQSLDKIDKILERYGTVSVSSMLVVEDKGQFALEYNQPVADYVSKARTGYQGAAQRFYQYAEEVQQAQVTQVDAEKAAMSALLGGPEGKALITAGVAAAGALGVTGAGPDTAQALLDAGEVEQSAPAFESQLKDNPAKAVLNSPTFSDPLDRFTPPTELSERRALLIGVNDKITENILKYLAHPEGIPENKILYLGVMEVSCNPGWETREGYLADVVVTPEYFRDPVEYMKDWLSFALQQFEDSKPSTQSGQNNGIEIEAAKGNPKPVVSADDAKGELLNANAFAIPFMNATAKNALAKNAITLPEVEKLTKMDAADLASTAKQIRDLIPVAEFKTDSAAFRAAASSLHDYYFGKGDSDINSLQPVVLAAFPLLEAQTLDLRNSERTQEAFVSYLATLMVQSGVSEQNETLEAMVERLEYDSASRSPIPLVTSYASGDSFGFQFMPAFQALADPADSARGSANVLHAYSFPALVLLQCERQEIAPPSKEKNGLGLDSIRLNVSSRWIPLRETAAWRRIDDRFRGGPTRYASRTRIGVANELDRAIGHYKSADASDADYFTDEEVSLRIRQLEPLATGVSLVSTLPPYNQLPKLADLQISDVQPRKGFYNADTVLTIEGTGFAKGSTAVVKSVTVAGRNCAFVVAGPTVLVAVVPTWTTDITNHDHQTPVSAEVVVATTRDTVTYPVPILFNEDRVLHYAEEDSVVQISRDANGHVNQIVINGAANGSESMLDALKGIISEETKRIQLSDLDLEVTVK